MYVAVFYVTGIFSEITYHIQISTRVRTRGGYIDVAIDTVGGESSKVDSLLCDLAKMCMQFLQIR